MLFLFQDWGEEMTADISFILGITNINLIKAETAPLANHRACAVASTLIYLN